MIFFKENIGFQYIWIIDYMKTTLQEKNVIFQNEISNAI